MSITVLVNKGFYINKNGEKVELNQNSLDIYFKEDYDKLELENCRLKAQLAKCKEQRNAWESCQDLEPKEHRKNIEIDDKELDAIK